MPRNVPSEFIAPSTSANVVTFAISPDSSDGSADCSAHTSKYMCKHTS